MDLHTLVNLVFGCIRKENIETVDEKVARLLKKMLRYGVHENQRYNISSPYILRRKKKKLTLQRFGELKTKNFL